MNDTISFKISNFLEYTALNPLIFSSQQNAGNEYWEFVRHCANILRILVNLILTTLWGKHYTSMSFLLQTRTFNTEVKWTPQSPTDKNLWGLKTRDTAPFSGT